MVSLLNGIDLSKCMLFSGGRIPADMATWAIRARILGSAYQYAQKLATKSK